MDENSTSFLLGNFMKSNSSSEGLDFINTNISNMADITFSDFFNDYLAKHYELKLADIVRDSGITRQYAYDIINGKRNGSRDKIISICFSACMSFDEINHALIYSGHNQLYIKNKRDAFIINAIKFKKNLNLTNTTALNAYLDGYNQEPLDI